ncbi:MAG: hypothetical protein ABEK75_09150, partial [Salinibacter sp.]
MEDETAHRPSAGQDNDADGPEQRIERRWRPAPVRGAVRPDGQNEEDSPPPPKSGNDPPDGPPPDPSSDSPGPDGSPDANAETEPTGPDDDPGDPSPSDPGIEDASSLFEPEGGPSQDNSSAPPGEPSPSDGSPSGDGTPASTPDASPPGDADATRPDTEQMLPPESPDAGREDARDRGTQINEEAFADASDDASWTDSWEPGETPPAPHDEDPLGDDKEFFTDETRRSGPADQVEDAIQDFSYRMNEGSASTDWTPEERTAQRTAKTFARLVSKVAEDMSYERRPGDEFWDPRKIMRRQIDNRPLRHCKMEYTKQRLALLVDTSPSCRDEAVFYSKIASGAMLRDDIDIYLCPNGHIDAKFDPEPMRFVTDDRGDDWGLEGRTVLYFTDWDGSDQLVAHSQNTNLYWFDNCPPEQYWESRRDRHRRTRLRYRGRHFHCPDPDAFQSLVRKIRP